MKRRILSCILALTMATSLLAGCGSDAGNANSSTEPEAAADAAQKDEPAAEAEEDAGNEAGEEGEKFDKEVTLTFWSPTWHKDADEQVIADFAKIYPNIKIEATFYSSDDIKTNTKVAASSGTLPDMWYNWGGFNYANYYASADLCYDLSSYAKENGWEDKYLKSALDLCTLDGKIIALPQVYTGLVMWYRTDILEQYGLEVPKTFEELENICKVLKENGQASFSTGGWHIFRYLEALLEYYAGPEEHDALNTLEADWGSSEAVTQAFAKLKEWGDKGYFIDGYVTEDANNAKMYVFGGTSAMVMDNSGMASDVVANEYDTSQYSFFAFPTGKDGNTGRISSYVKTTQFNKNLTEDQFEAAMLFWDYYYSEESLKSHPSIEQPTAVAGAELSEAMKLADGMLEMIDAAGSYTTTDQDVPNEIMDVVFATEEAVLLGTIEPSAAGAEIQKAIDAYKAASK